MGGCVITRRFDIVGDSPSFLIIALRYIGDVLVTTPLALSIKQHIPGARVEYLVFDGTESVLAKNPYVDKVNIISRSSRNPLDALRLMRKFDFALATNYSDRTAIFAGLSGKKSLGFSLYPRKDWWKRLVLDYCCQYHDRNHAVQQILSIVEPLGIPKIPVVTMAFDQGDSAFVRSKMPHSRYVVLHPYSRGQYKYWSPEKWGKLAELIQRQTACVPVFTVTADPRDRELLDAILAHTPDGCLSFPEPFTLTQLAAAIQGSEMYVGIDTVVTHIAAAVGAPTVALFGPTLTRYWAPWPNGCTEESPFLPNHGVQRVGNVTVIQKNWPCVPCNKETCAISTRGRIECLEQLQAEEVLDVISTILGMEVPME